MTSQSWPLHGHPRHRIQIYLLFICHKVPIRIKCFKGGGDKAVSDRGWGEAVKEGLLRGENHAKLLTDETTELEAAESVQFRETESFDAQP